MTLPDSREQEIRRAATHGTASNADAEHLIRLLDAVLTRAERAEQERDELLRSEELAAWVESEAELHEVQARVAELERTKIERERDEARGASYYQQIVGLEADRSGLAMRCAELEKALTVKDAALTRLANLAREGMYTVQIIDLAEKALAAGRPEEQG